MAVFGVPASKPGTSAGCTLRDPWEPGYGSGSCTLNPLGWEEEAVFTPDYKKPKGRPGSKSKQAPSFREASAHASEQEDLEG